jgi:hypothetical protein
MQHLPYLRAIKGHLRTYARPTDKRPTSDENRAKPSTESAIDTTAFPVSHFPLARSKIQVPSPVPVTQRVFETHPPQPRNPAYQPGTRSQPSAARLLGLGPWLPGPWSLVNLVMLFAEARGALALGAPALPWQEAKGGREPGAAYLTFLAALVRTLHAAPPPSPGT